MNDCIFCKILNNEIPSFTVYEDEDFKAILDIAPATKGHVLIIPKEHSENIFELSNDKAEKLFLIAKKITTALKNILNVSNFNLIQNNGRIAGQTVNHFHLHIIPRYSLDEISLWVPHENDPSVTESFANEVKNAIK